MHLGGVLVTELGGVRLAILRAMLKRPPCSGATPSSIPSNLLAGVSNAGGNADCLPGSIGKCS